MNKPLNIEKAFQRELKIASILFAFFFIFILLSGGYIITKDLGEKEVFRTLQKYKEELEKMTTNIPETEIAKGYKYEKIVTTRINQFVISKKIFDSFELYDSEGKLIHQQDFLKERGFIASFELKEPPMGQSLVEIRKKVPIEVPVQIAPGKMGKAVLNISERVLYQLAKEFRDEMFFKISTLLTIIFVMQLISYLYVIHLIKKSRMVQKELEEENKYSHLGLLSSGLAHEIKNPLNTLKVNIQLLEEGIKGNAEKSEILSSTEIMMNEIKRLEKLTRDFLMYAKPLTLEINLIDLTKIFNETIAQFDRELKEKSIEVVINKNSEKELFGDENLLRVAFSNIIKNGIEASKIGGKIIISLIFSESSCLIEITNFGEPIDPKIKERIFDAFFTTKPEGTGLGLAITKKLIELHKGSIKVETEGEKTTFFVKIPLSQMEAKDDNR